MPELIVTVTNTLNGIAPITIIGDIQKEQIDQIDEFRLFKIDYVQQDARFRIVYNLTTLQLPQILLLTLGLHINRFYQFDTEEDYLMFVMRYDNVRTLTKVMEFDNSYLARII